MSTILQRTSLQPTISEIASPLNQAKWTGTSMAAAKRVGASPIYGHSMRAMQTALVSLAAQDAQEHAEVHSELDAFDRRLDACIKARPLLADSGRRPLPWVLPGSEPKQPSAAALKAEAALKAAFAKIDKNSDGTLSRAELIKACKADADLRALLGLPAAINDANRDAFEGVFQSLDADGSKKIDFTEFKAFFAAQQGASSSAASSKPSKVGGTRYLK